jgi:C4-dicarboxylate-specific signal transduction histidine kinase
MDGDGAGAHELRRALAHELNQPLAAIALHARAASLWLKKPVPEVEKALAALEQLAAAADACGAAVRDMAVRPPPGAAPAAPGGSAPPGRPAGRPVR